MNFPAPSGLQEEGGHKDQRNRVELRKVLVKNAIVRRVGQLASDDKDYPRRKDLPHRGDDQSQSKREERPGHGRSGRCAE